ncbi:MAG: rhodanese-like domain-containing protein [Candidatus Eremiobacterota bacterium]
MPDIITPARLDELKCAHPDIRLLDVRTPGEFDSAHIAGAYNVPLDDLAEHSAEIRTVTAPVVLVCQSGSRAGRAEELLKRSGMENLYLLEGGMNRWLKEDRPVRRGRPRLSLERQVRTLAGFLVSLFSLLALLVHPGFAAVPALMGCGLVYAGLTDRCGMTSMLALLPYNRVKACDVAGAVAALCGPG